MDMTFKESQGRWDKVHTFFIGASIFSAVIGVLGLLSKTVPVMIGGAAAGIFFGRMTAYAARQTRLHFDLANIQGLIKAPGLSERQRARMARRIYRTNGQ
jgi:hypothetical protein